MDDEMTFAYFLQRIFFFFKEWYKRISGENCDELKFIF